MKKEKILLINIKYIFIFFIVLCAGCKIATLLSSKIVDNHTRVRYTLFYNNRNANHKPSFIYVSVDTLNSRSHGHSFYHFQLNSDTIYKFHSYANIRSISILITDTSNSNSTASLTPITQLESDIFDKVINLTDSLNLKNFHFLKKQKGFKIVSQGNHRLSFKKEFRKLSI